MNFSPEQIQALDAVAAWIRNPSKPYFYLAGYAGSGKTTLAQHFASGISGLTCFAAYTGKAAYVLQQRGCPRASTIHSLIYKPSTRSTAQLQEYRLALNELVMGMQISVEDEEERENILLRNIDYTELLRKIKIEEENLGRPFFKINPESPLNHAELVVIDECSMVDTTMGEDLLSFGVPVLVLGDPAQLPPVANAGYFTSQTPDFQLTQIHRQAADSPIIRLATDVREGRRLSLGGDEFCRVIRRSEVSPELASGVDQIIVGTNAFRRNMNNRIRELKGFTDWWPQAGERIVCLKNNHDLGLLNGGLWNVVDCKPDEDLLQLEIRSEDSSQAQVCMAHAKPFRGEKMDWWEREGANEFDFGYTLTGHKSQGSQWPSVLAFDQSGTFRQDARKWLYTVVTRASERLVLAI